MFIKDPDSVLDYKFDWSSWLDAGETITVSTVTTPAGIIKDSDSITDTNTSVTVWLSGGIAGVNYKIANKITTSAGRTDERSIIINMLNK